MRRSARPLLATAVLTALLAGTALTGCAPSVVVRIDGDGEARLIEALVIVGDQERIIRLSDPGELALTPLPYTFGLAPRGLETEEPLTVCVTAEVDGNRGMGCGRGHVEDGIIDVPLCLQFQLGSRPPRPASPMNGATVGSVLDPESLRPRLSWDVTSLDGEEAIAYEVRYFTDEVALFDAHYALTAKRELTPATSLPVATNVPVGSRYYWQTRAAFADGRCTAWSRRSYLDLGRSNADLNGDGFDDIAIGAPTLDFGGDTDAGAVYIFLGPINIPSGALLQADNADVILRGASALDRFGSSIAYVGDFDSDGFSDLVVGSPGAGGAAGEVSIYYGAEELTARPPLRYPGLVVGAEVGSTVSAAGDFNADGYADVALATPPGPSGNSSAFVFLGNDANSNVELAFFGFGLTDDLFGTSLASGDLNGDGYSDLVVGAPGSDLNGDGEPDGAAYVYFGGIGIRSPFPDVQIFSDLPDSWFGWSAVGAGDLDRDGYADLFIGAPGRDNPVAAAGPERVELFFGEPTPPEVWSASLVIEPQGVFGGFGFSLATGDVNGDGCPDLAVGVPFATGFGANGGAGTLFAFPCGRPLEPPKEVPLTPNAPGTFSLGYSSAFVDWDGSGSEDVVLGAPGAGGPGADSSGRVFLFRADGTSAEPVKEQVPVIVGKGVNDRLGETIARP